MEASWFEERRIPPERALQYADACVKGEVKSLDALEGLLDDEWFKKTFSLPGDQGEIRFFFKNQRQGS